MYNPYFQNNSNILPAQQILQANGKASIDMIRLAPNSSVLIADTTAPIIWRCVSDSLGNTTSEPFDIIPHKDEEQIRKESLEQRISRLEEFIYEQSNTTRNVNDESEPKTGNAVGKSRRKSSGDAKSGDDE
jgi:hypothetical protein